jgi:hypothetical protein
MRALFTVHVGEYLVGSHIEKHYRHLSVWIPSRDTGVDLMVSDHKARSTASIQVKFSKDFLPTHMKAEFQKPLRACSWFRINRDKLRNSQAEFWVFVLSGFKKLTYDFVVVPRRDLLSRLSRIHKSEKQMVDIYLWITENGLCWDARGLKKGDRRKIADGVYGIRERNFTKWLNNWGPVAGKLNP